MGLTEELAAIVDLPLYALRDDLEIQMKKPSAPVGDDIEVTLLIEGVKTK